MLRMLNGSDIVKVNWFAFHEEKRRGKNLAFHKFLLAKIEKVLLPNTYLIRLIPTAAKETLLFYSNNAG